MKALTMIFASALGISVQVADEMSVIKFNVTHSCEDCDLRGSKLTGASADFGAGSPIEGASWVGSSKISKNILFIMSDDHTTQGIGVYNSHLSALDPTPTLDKLATEGTIFRLAHSTNAICSPSRAAILTGQYSHVNGVLDLHGNLPSERQYLPQLLKKAGYETAIIGKWHLKSEPGAFDHYEVLRGQGTYFDPELRIQGDKPWPENVEQTVGHSSDIITDRALAWLKNRKSDKPFALFHHFKAPHDMFENAPRYNDYLADIDIPEPNNLWNQAEWGSKGTRGVNDSLRDTIGSSVSHRNKYRNMATDLAELHVKLQKKGDVRNLGIDLKIDLNLSDEDFTRQTYQTFVKRYLRCVKGVDDNIKRMLDYIDDAGIADDTIVIYTSDQGFFLGEHDLIDKRWMYEEALNMPLIVKYPGKNQAPKQSKLIVNNTDFAPTVLGMIGVKTPSEMQGRDFSAVFEGKSPDNWRNSTYYRYWMNMAHHYNPAHFGIRTDKYKLIFFYGQHFVEGGSGKWPEERKQTGMRTPPAWELYDLSKDPHENINEYSNPDYVGVIKQLKVELAQLREIYQDTDEHYPHLQELVQKHWID